ncbi:hypothetical protein ACS0TY_022909 [Phlomoides rotata]
MMSAFSKVLESSKFLNTPSLPFEEWNIDFSEITIGSRLRIAFFGEVFRGSWNGLEVGIKVFLEQDPTIENIEDFCNEISILSRIRHPNASNTDIVENLKEREDIPVVIGSDYISDCIQDKMRCDLRGRGSTSTHQQVFIFHDW